MNRSAGPAAPDVPAVGAAAVSPEASVEAFDRFYRAECKRLVRLLVGMTGRWGVAEEMAQEALLSAYREWSRLEALDRPDLWLRHVAVNRAISARRRLMAEVAALARVRAERIAEPSDLDTDGRLWAAVRELPRRQAAAVVLWAVEDLTFAEVGIVLGCSAETARTHLRRARERLALSLQLEVDDVG